MIWVGSFKSLQSALRKSRFPGAPLEVHTWLRSEIGLISPLARKIHDFRSTKGLAMVQIRCLGGFETKNEAFA